MNSSIQLGENIFVGESKFPCCVERLLGDGGQGKVYQVNMQGQSLALKWYRDHAATASQYESLKFLVKRQPPTPFFLWPLDLAHSDHASGFGYVMALRDPEYRDLADLIGGKVSATFRSRAWLGYQLATAFLALHKDGLCYRDISFGNAFFHPETGDALICDNDNVTIDDDPNGNILGTPKFMAPEIVCGRARPSSQTDRFSLAILIFRILMLDHPLEGALEAAVDLFTEEDSTRLYGTDPVFIHDPRDASNRPVPGVHDAAIVYWDIYPSFIKDLFIQSFTGGLLDPARRVVDSQWRRAMIQLRDSVFYCRHCSAENFYDPIALRARQGSAGFCWNCGQGLALPARMRIGNEVVVLECDFQLFPHHIDSQRLWNFDEPVGRLVQNPSNPSMWGIENLSPNKWTFCAPDGSLMDVPPGKRASLVARSKVMFGSRTGEIAI